VDIGVAPSSLLSNLAADRSPWLFFKVDVCQRLGAVVADNKRRDNLTVQGLGKRCVIADLFGGVNFAEPENF
jgi:hypothetical protein